LELHKRKQIKQASKQSKVKLKLSGKEIFGA